MNGGSKLDGAETEQVFERNVNAVAVDGGAPYIGTK